MLGDPLALPKWWPSVYLEVDELRRPDVHGIGRRAALVTRGWLPVHAALGARGRRLAQYPNGFTIEVTGDLVGRGEWTLTQDGPFVDVVYDWRISAEKPLLKRASAVFKPVFEANHRWAMARGEESLRLELLRRRATTPEARAAVQAPPGPVTYAGVALVAGAVAVAGTLAWLALKRPGSDD